MSFTSYYRHHHITMASLPPPPPPTLTHHATPILTLIQIPLSSPPHPYLDPYVDPYVDPYDMTSIVLHRRRTTFTYIAYILVRQVLHPHIYKCVSRDLTILTRLAAISQWMMPSLGWLSFKESVEEFAELMMRQVHTTRYHHHHRQQRRMYRVVYYVELFISNTNTIIIIVVNLK